MKGLPVQEMVSMKTEHKEDLHVFAGLSAPSSVFKSQIISSRDIDKDVDYRFVLQLTLNPNSVKSRV